MIHGRALQVERTVTLLACHPESGQSMRRYGALLESAYVDAGWTVQVVRPTSRFSDHAANPRVRKLLVYVEKLILFPATLPLRLRSAHRVHVTDHSDAPWLRRLPSRTIAIITCHDLIAIRAASGRIPEHRPRPSGRVYQRYIAASMHRADLVAAVSEVTLADVRAIFPDRPSRLLRNPVLPNVTTAVSSPDQPGIDQPYLLVVASSNWRKRRHLAIEAWRRLRSASPERPVLVIVGDPLTADERALTGMTDRLDAGITVVEDVDDRRLAALYAGALGLLQLSSLEGFGWPVVEANYWGTVVVAADLPVLREVGPKNLFVPDDLAAVDWSRVKEDLHDERRRAEVRIDARRFDVSEFRRELIAIASNTSRAEQAETPAPPPRAAR